MELEKRNSINSSWESLAKQMNQSEDRISVFNDKIDVD